MSLHYAPPAGALPYLPDNDYMHPAFLGTYIDTCLPSAAAAVAATIKADAPAFVPSPLYADPAELSCLFGSAGPYAPAHALASPAVAAAPSHADPCTPHSDSADSLSACLPPSEPPRAVPYAPAASYADAGYADAGYTGAGYADTHYAATSYAATSYTTSSAGLGPAPYYPRPRRGAVFVPRDISDPAREAFESSAGRWAEDHTAAARPTAARRRRSAAATKKAHTKSYTETTNMVLYEWLKRHVVDPYPSQQDKLELMQLTGLTKMQLKNWFCNMRRRKLPSTIKRSKMRTK
ncbi:hypothetical protein H4R18_004745 [Coemansia javaensis]|uniref:Homeobox domain-containing protein n=1 Tax=Coemansia javaensis TaxID=2761396 RepID=A0A9W8LFD4_9FUNG|nr:hypothetical protein H4R18_004745 [Coemansia javaensis]